MKKYIKFISGVLALCILTATVCGCDKNSGASTVKKPSKPQTADSSDTSSDNSSDNTSSDDDTSIDISDDFEDLDFDIDFTTNQVFTFAKTAVNSNIKGTGGILPCWWYFPDSTIDGGYSESDIQIAVEQLKNMKVSIVRCLSFQPGYAWDEASSSYNWDSVYMKAFYRYAKVLKDNGMESLSTLTVTLPTRRRASLSALLLKGRATLKMRMNITDFTANGSLSL